MDKTKKIILRRRMVNKLTSDLPKLCRFAVFSCKLKFNAEKSIDFSFEIEYFVTYLYRALLFKEINIV